MARGNFDSLVLNVRLDSKQRALENALLVPWRELAASANEYVQWHAFFLWVRALVEATGDLPDGIRSELRTRCPGFLHGNESAEHPSLWKRLQEWIVMEHFAPAHAGGWFDAMMYYAYKDVRVKQAWSLWERSKADWGRPQPDKLPTFDQWKLQISATHTLAQGLTEKAPVVAAMENVDRGRLESAVADVIERRAVILWADCVSKTDQPLDPPVVAEIENRCPGAITVVPAEYTWSAPTLARLIRSVESHWRETARREGWHTALRYHVANHPRYQRLLHYRQRCHDEWLRIRPISLPSFPAWLASADAYCVVRTP
jgi:hypothetical protein